jgi:hypothetical protein
LSSYFVLVERRDEEPITSGITANNPEGAVLQALAVFNIKSTILSISVYYDEDSHDRGEKPLFIWLAPTFIK